MTHMTSIAGLMSLSAGHSSFKACAGPLKIGSASTSYVSYSLNSLKGGSIGEYIRDYYKGY